MLHEQGAEVTVVARAPQLFWGDRTPERISPLGHIRRPVTKLCESWRCVAWNSPAFVRLLPQDMRVTKARTVLGPSGVWWLKDRIEGVVEVLASHRVTAAADNGSGPGLVMELQVRWLNGDWRLVAPASGTFDGAVATADLTDFTPLPGM